MCESFTGYQLHVSLWCLLQLSFRTTWQSLKDHFKRAGTYVRLSLFILYTRNGGSVCSNGPNTYSIHCKSWSGQIFSAVQWPKTPVHNITVCVTWTVYTSVVMFCVHVEKLELGHMFI